MVFFDLKLLPLPIGQVTQLTGILLQVIVFSLGPHLCLCFGVRRSDTLLLVHLLKPNTGHWPIQLLRFTGFECFFKIFMSRIWCDNISVFSLASNPIFHVRTKHREIITLYGRGFYQKTCLLLMFLLMISLLIYVLRGFILVDSTFFDPSFRFCHSSSACRGVLTRFNI